MGLVPIVDLSLKEAVSDNMVPSLTTLVDSF